LSGFAPAAAAGRGGPADHRRVSSSSAASTIRLLIALIAAAALAIVPAAAGAAAPKAKKAAPKRTYVFCVVAKAAKAKPKHVAKAKPKKAAKATKARAASIRVNRATARRIARLRLAGHRVIVKRCAPAAKKKGSSTASTTTKAAAKAPAKGGKGSGKGGSTATTTTPTDNTAATKPVVAPKPAPAASGSGLNLGLVADTQGWGAQMGARMDAATATGVRWLREEFSWSAIEPKDNQWSWGRYDQLMTESSKRGVHIVALAMTTPGWAGATWDTISDDPTQYAQFVAALAGRYGPGGSFWADHPALTAVPLEQIELLNEPFLPQFAAGDTNAARYARLVRRVGRPRRQPRRAVPDGLGHDVV
jgi:hypothetical protein